MILSEIFAAISVQKKNGHFILKVFDILTETSINLIYLLFLCYKKVYIYKPKTSRPTNSEKYIICKYFDLSDDNRNIILNELSQLTETTYAKRSEKSPAIKSFTGEKKSFDDGFIRAESVGTLPKLNDIGLVGNYGSDIILTYLSILSKFR